MGPRGPAIALLVRWRARRHAAFALAAIGDTTRKDVGLSPRSSDWEDQLRFLPMPERVGPFGPDGR